jgi:amino acid transporter
VLGFRDLVLFYIVVTLSLRWIPFAAAAGPGTVVIWLVGVLTIFLPLALCVMELSSRYPQEGGMYVWSKLAFGDFAGFLTGWIYWTSNLPYFPTLLYFAASNALYLGSGRWQKLQSSPLYFVLFSFAGLLLALGLNLVGLNVGKWLNNAGALGTWIPILLIWAMGAIAFWRLGSATHFTARSFTPSLTLSNSSMWAALLSAFAGAEAATLMNGEIKRPRHSIPWALMVAGVLICAGYILGTLAMLVVLPHQQLNGLEGIMQAIAASGRRVGWSGLGPAVALLICIANLGAVGAYLAAVGRLPFVAGIDQYLPAAFARVHPRWRTPHVALITQMLCCAMVVVLGQAGATVRAAYQLLVSMTIIATFLPYLFLFAVLFWVQSQAAAPEVVRIPGGRPAASAIAVLGFAATLLVVVGSAMPDQAEPNKVSAVAKVVALTFVLVGAGALVYWLGKRRVERVSLVQPF